MDDKHYYKEFRGFMEMKCLFGKCDKCSYVHEGMGVHKVVIYDLFEVSEKVECSECDGKGHKESECINCHGTGECPDCDGSGQENSNCKNCGGKGIVWEDEGGILKESVFCLRESVKSEVVNVKG